MNGSGRSPHLRRAVPVEPGFPGCVLRGAVSTGADGTTWGRGREPSAVVAGACVIGVGRVVGRSGASGVESPTSIIHRASSSLAAIDLSELLNENVASQSPWLAG